MNCKSPTERLREMLDERGVEYEAYRDVKNRCIAKWRTYHGAFVFFAVEEEGKLFVETASGTKHSAICTPEQAIAATLGSGECELHECEGSFSALNRPVWRCDCGAFMTQYTDATTYHKPRFCPNCGKAVSA